METKSLSEELLDKEAEAFDSRVDAAFSFLASYVRTCIPLFGWGETYLALSRLFSYLHSWRRSTYESKKFSLSDLP